MAFENQARLRSNEEFLLDQWTGLDYKTIIATDSSHGVDWMAPTWVGEHRRRLQAYTAFKAYNQNAARLLLRILDPESLESRNQRREYGDAAVLLEEILSSTIGDQQSIAVDGADDYDKNNPTPEALAAFELQQDLVQWADDEQLILKLIETEGNASMLGDGVYGLEYSTTKRRVRLRTWDPGAYFPVIDDTLDYSRRVHIAWQIVEDDGTTSKRVRRISYELRKVTPYSVPWSEELVTDSCFLSDGIFTLDSESRNPDELTLDAAVWITDDEGQVRDRDLGIDFIPIVHIPNTVAVEAHYGQSDLLPILQLLDDIQSTDSDLQSSAAMTGGPMLALSGDSIDDNIELGPKKAIKLGANGRATMLSGAEGMGALQQLLDNLLRRLSVNARVPEAKLGRIDPSKIEAGIIMALSFGPLGSLVERKRLVRKPKYRLLLKFKQRFDTKEAAARGEEVREILDAGLVFGSYLPSDLAGTARVVMDLYKAKLISLSTAQKMLQEVGVAIEDLSEEQAEIDQRDYEGANLLADATGNDKAVADKLGVNVDKLEPPPQLVNNPPPPPTGEQPPELDEDE